jgi:hypothetical protein
MRQIPTQHRARLSTRLLVRRRLAHLSDQLDLTNRSPQPTRRLTGFDHRAQHCSSATMRNLVLPPQQTCRTIPCWGYSELRPGQRPVLRSIVSARVKRGEHCWVSRDPTTSRRGETSAAAAWPAPGRGGREPAQQSRLGAGIQRNPAGGADRTSPLPDRGPARGLHRHR